MYPLWFTCPIRAWQELTSQGHPHFRLCMGVDDFDGCLPCDCDRWRPAHAESAMINNDKSHSNRALEREVPMGPRSGLSVNWGAYPGYPQVPQNCERLRRATESESLRIISPSILFTSDSHQRSCVRAIAPRASVTRRSASPVSPFKAWQWASCALQNGKWLFPFLGLPARLRNSPPRTRRAQTLLIDATRRVASLCSWRSNAVGPLIDTLDATHTDDTGKSCHFHARSSRADFLGFRRAWS
jgi:hypothetical protein